MLKTGLILAIALSTVSMTACSKKEEAKVAEVKEVAKKVAAVKVDAKAAVAAAGDKVAATGAAAEAAAMFKAVCVMCHGATGKGDGVAAANLNPKPRAFSDAAWQKGTTDASIAKVILEGGASIGKSPLMPPNPSLKDKKEVLAELVKLIRAMK